VDDKYKFFIVNNVSMRDSADRADLIVERIKSIKGSYLDIGSQLGYFVFRVSDRNFFATGIECSKNPFLYSNSLKVINRKQNVDFINMCIDSRNVYNLPSYDVVSVLNVFHHFVYFYGYDQADEIMKEIANKTNKMMFFETGEYEEKGEYWSESLDFMGHDTKTWIYDYLKSLGFSEVVEIGEFGTHLNEHKRTLYACHK